MFSSDVVDSYSRHQRGIKAPISISTTKLRKSRAEQNILSKSQGRAAACKGIQNWKYRCLCRWESNTQENPTFNAVYGRCSRCKVRTSSIFDPPLDPPMSVIPRNSILVLLPGIREALFFSLPSADIILFGAKNISMAEPSGRTVQRGVGKSPGYQPFPRRSRTRIGRVYDANCVVVARNDPAIRKDAVFFLDLKRRNAILLTRDDPRADDTRDKVGTAPERSRRPQKASYVRNSKRKYSYVQVRGAIRT
ncbi:hypothetical protein P152DRAFT_134199 [Eremomyces bilateralis CBS 781.70]|uniref:Uncharacterized protein n=1 Tax=Eremomyces bilateralis CBS 781.70 TaxID=1392243 RepID=A0A6G1GFL2_9PEZI|nr:uncharacterized protein P152DRAFT_134199 [Eremomyces bilateralis CBS 781.70]KAF1816706.1 hypothetical protein P152DRAFT_134199 [Eremomyces bilateralis CBS 781.70]